MPDYDLATDDAISREKVSLEQKYIRLLEERIEQLQVIVDGHKSKSPDDTSNDASKADTATNEKEPVSNTTTEEAEKVESASKEDMKESESSDKDTKSDTNKPLARVRFVTARYDEKSMEYIDADSTDAVQEPTDVEKPKASTTFRRYMDTDNPAKILTEEILIESTGLRQLYKELTSSPSSASDQHISPAADEQTKLVRKKPFKEIVWNWDKFEAACSTEEGDSKDRADARDDLKQLMNVLKTKSSLEPFMKVRQDALTSRKMPYEFLWTIFHVGTKVVAKTFLDEISLLEVVDSYYVGKYFLIQCRGFDWDGSEFSGFEYIFSIKESSRQADSPIDSLEVYPLDFYKNPEKLMEDLTNRGRIFWNMNKYEPENFQYDYSGPVLVLNPSQSGLASLIVRQAQKRDDDWKSSLGSEDIASSTVPSKKDYDGPVIVDAYAFIRAQDSVSTVGQSLRLGSMTIDSAPDYDCDCKTCGRSPILQWQRKQQRDHGAFGQGKGSKERLMMCPPRVLGYGLKSKAWLQLRALDFRTTDKDDTSAQQSYFKDQLQLEEKYKRMLLAFVHNHQSIGPPAPTDDSVEHQPKTPKSLDVIEGKGKGLAVLLHGPPGVGKTLTAETIALATKRPLLTVSVAEIGQEAGEAEERLNIYFNIAARWGAILLIDEADVFLEERTRTDNPNRNMLVSVLLRCLEYYEGIIFLTTNRIRAIDSAVQSRMHLAIQYKRLQQKHKVAIYKNLLKKLDDNMIKGDRASMQKNIKDQLCRRNDMNGRQIRNIVSAAIAIANERAKNRSEPFALRFEDLREVHETTSDFIESLKDTTAKMRGRNEVAENDGSEDDD